MKNIRLWALNGRCFPSDLSNHEWAVLAKRKELRRPQSLWPQWPRDTEAVLEILERWWRKQAVEIYQCCHCMVVCRGCLSRCDKPFIAAGLIFWTELWLVYCHQHHHRLFLFCFDLPREWEMSFRLSFSLCRCRACKVGVAMLTCFW